jgi:hypothetical protein
MRRYAQMTFTIVWRCSGELAASRCNAYSAPSLVAGRSEPNWSTAFVYRSVIRRSDASSSTIDCVYSLWTCRLAASRTVASPAAPAPIASATFNASSCATAVSARISGNGQTSKLTDIASTASANVAARATVRILSGRWFCTWCQVVRDV